MEERKVDNIAPYNYNPIIDLELRKIIRKELESISLPDLQRLFKIINTRLGED